MANELIEEFASIDNEIKERDAVIKKLKKRKRDLEEPLLELFAELGVTSVVTESGRTVHLHRQIWANARTGEDGARNFNAACAALEATGNGDMVERKFNVTKVSALVRELENSEDGIPVELRDNLQINEIVRVRIRG